MCATTRLFGRPVGSTAGICGFGFWISGSLDLWISGSLDLWISGSVDLWISRSGSGSLRLGSLNLGYLATVTLRYGDGLRA